MNKYILHDISVNRKTKKKMSQSASDNIIIGEGSEKTIKKKCTVFRKKVLAFENHVIM